MGSGTRSIAEHRAAALARVGPVDVVEVRLDDPAATGLTLAADVVAAAPVPAFDHAAMDGYAVRLADLPADGTTVELAVLGDVRPGTVPEVPEVCEHGAAGTTAGEGVRGRRGAVRIMTGAPLPAGYDAVVPVERTSTGRFVAGGPTTERAVTLARQPRDHVRRAGGDLQTGTLIAKAGTRLGPGLLATAAAAGVVVVTARRRPRVAVMSTGSELADLGTTAPGAVPDSNSVMLAALARAWGADVVRTGAVPDAAEALRTALDAASGPPGPRSPTDAAAPHAVDLIVTSGGVSAGASDVVREVLAGSDAHDVDVATVAMRPGKPQALATWHGVPWIAVPGNPVSAFVSFVLYAAPAIRRLAGEPAGSPPHDEVAAAAGWSSPAGVEQVLPVTLGPDGAVPAATDGHHLSALPHADALVVVPADVTAVRPGDHLAVIRLPEPR
ncbi:gephyrin-like molybdotransferase Glp [Isoptericola jiangsuensis]|uniref:molybdopterin molybdotransferase MoeA n=1 Tax=Isoptericola jiangsuensis TaxID=548579 RepID=UPI003AAF0F9D